LTSRSGNCASAILASRANRAIKNGFQADVSQCCIAVVIETSGTSLCLERASFTITTDWTWSTNLRIQRQVVIWYCSAWVRRLWSSWSDVVCAIIRVYAIESRITKSSWRFSSNFSTESSWVANGTLRLRF
jgi:hypothetical protein